MADLVTLAYVTETLTPLGLTAAQTAILPRLITATSKRVERWCRRTFEADNLCESAWVSPHREVMLSRPPILRVDRVMEETREALVVRYAGTGVLPTVRLVLDAVDPMRKVPTGLVLSAIVAGVSSSSTLTFASSPTLAQLVTAINGTSGWLATLLDSSLSSWPSADLVGGQVGLGAMGQGATLSMFTKPAAIHEVDFDAGILRINGPRRFADDLFEIEQREHRVWYRGGFEVIPEDVQLAVTEAVRLAVTAIPTDPTLRSEEAGEYKYQLADPNDDAAGVQLPEHVLAALSPYRLLA